MTKYRFTKKDFDVFRVDGLAARMEALIETTRPKLENLGEHFAAYITEMTGDEHYAHVAQHARRKVNPPDDTWVSFSTNPRGYKMMPHFQIGLFKDHAFCMYGVIYESDAKVEVAKRWLENIEMFDDFPREFQVSLDHMQPEKMVLGEMSDEELKAGLNRVVNVKKGEFLVGKVYKPGDAEMKKDADFIADLERVMEQLHVLYK